MWQSAATNRTKKHALHSACRCLVVCSQAPVPQSRAAAICVRLKQSTPIVP